MCYIHYDEYYSGNNNVNIHCGMIDEGESLANNWRSLVIKTHNIVIRHRIGG